MCFIKVLRQHNTMCNDPFYFIGPMLVDLDQSHDGWQFKKKNEIKFCFVKLYVPTSNTACKSVSH